LKVTTIFVFSFFCLVVGPAHFYADDQPKWVAGAGMSIDLFLFSFTDAILLHG
jgi:hypothetical protein